jgi:hypothetical protein
MDTTAALDHELGFAYRDFYDVPRLIVVPIGTRLVLLDSPFDPTIDDYASLYNVYVLPPGYVLPEGSWEHLVTDASPKVGTIAVASVKFDSTKRRSLHGGALTPFADRILGT